MKKKIVCPACNDTLNITEGFLRWRWQCPNCSFIGSMKFDEKVNIEIVAQEIHKCFAKHVKER